ncbi:MAG TPA: hypothetical protein VGC72_06355 [Candidatus Elarobacter sp.]|jgi:hypothetical protein
MQAKLVRRAIVASAFITVLLTGPAEASTTNVRIVRSAGTCPAAIAIRWTSVQYEGGSTMDVTALTMAVATTSELVAATRKRIEFRADLRPQYASCTGTGRDGGDVFTLRGGKLTFVINNEISSGQYPGVEELDVKGGNPHVILGIAD